MRKAFTIVLLATCLVPLLMGQSYTVQTIAGSLPDRNGGTVNTLYLLSPEAVVMDKAGNTYIADTGSHKVWKIDTAGMATLVIGTGVSDLSTSGAAAKGKVGLPSGLVTDAAGNLYIADRDNARVIKVDTKGDISVFAGYGSGRYTGDGRPAVSGGINSPRGLAIDTAGNIYIADRSNHRIRKVDTAGTITTVAGVGDGFSGDGGPARQAKLSNPEDVGVDAAGNIYIADTGNNRVRKVDATTGIIDTIAGSGAYTLGNNAEGSVFITESGTPGAKYTDVLSCSSRDISCFRGDGFQGTQALLYGPSGVAVGKDVLYIADRGNSRIRALDLNSGIIRTAASGVGFPGRIYLDQGTGRLLIPDMAGNTAASHTVLLLDPSRSFVRAAEQTRAYSGAKRTSASGPATQTVLNNPFGVAVDSAGNVFFSETANHRVLKIDTTGSLSVVAGTGVSGNAGDDGLATNAKLNTPKGVALDAAGNLYIADQQNNRIRMVGANGIITTFATGFSRPVGVAVDSAGNVYVADTRNHVVKKISAGGGGEAVVFAGTSGSSGAAGDGGSPTDALLNAPQAVAVSADGKNVYVADSANCTVRVITNGKIYPLAGSAGSCDYDAASSSVKLAYDRRFRAGIAGVAVDKSGNVFIADTNNSRIRKVDPSLNVTVAVGNGPSGPGLAGVLIASAGSNSTDNALNTLPSTINFNGDGASDQVGLSQPAGVAIDANGNLFIADQGNGLVRKAVLSK